MRPEGSRRIAARREPGDAGREPVEPCGERVRPVPLVATEDLVAAVADERHSHEPARVLGDQERRQRRRVAERLVERVREARQERRCVGLDEQLLVHGAEALRDQPGVARARRSAPRGSRPRTSAPARLRSSAIAATTMLESMPPESSAPSGTSATSRLRTAREDPVADGLDPLLVARAARACASSCQYGSTVTRAVLDGERAPGGSRLMPRERGAVAGDVAEREVRVEPLELDVPRDAREA